MEFKTTEEAWNLWVNMLEKNRFNVGRYYNNQSPIIDKSTLTTFICSNEGFHSKDK
jgi:hypothetical protein